MLPLDQAVNLEASEAARRRVAGARPAPALGSHSDDAQRRLVADAVALASYQRSRLRLVIAMTPSIDVAAVAEGLPAAAVEAVAAMLEAPGTTAVLVGTALQVVEFLACCIGDPPPAQA